MNCSPVRTPRKPVFNFLQNIAASNSVPASTWFTTRRIRRRYFTHGHPDLVRAPQVAFTDHVNAFGVFNKLGKVFPSASSQKEFIGYVVITESTDSYPMIKVPATEARYPSHPELVNCNARVLARIAGQCIVMTKAIVPGKLLVRNAYRLGRRSSWDSPLLLDGRTRDDTVVPRAGVLERPPYQNKNQSKLNSSPMLHKQDGEQFSVESRQQAIGTNKKR